MSSTPPEHLDVLVIGAGISGVGVARYLRTELPHTRFAVLEARAALGGTWDLFRYPGIRSDSDLHTFGYEFKPWTDVKSIASGDRILDYLRQTAAESGVDQHLRFQHKVIDAAWSTEQARWTVRGERTDTGERFELTASWIFGATGYYDYDAGFTPHFEGRDRFRGDIVHPQHWPEGFDYTGKKVLVIGSGATAVTLIPAMVEGGAGHVTMLQRTPSYVLPLPSEDRLANWLPRVLGVERGYALARRKNILQQTLIWKFCTQFPVLARRFIRSQNAKALPAGFDVDRHFNPPYNPWEQRLCVVPDGDLFRTIRDGSASVVTDKIVMFTETGVCLESGDAVEADVIVTATGLNLQLLGGISLTIDGMPFDAPNHIAYKGMMLSDVPNMAFSIGYTNASWTLKVGLVCEHFCRLLSHMQEHGYDACVPVAPPMQTRPLLDFSAGYVRRSLGELPRQGVGFPWVMSMSYQDDVRLVRAGPVVDAHLRFSRVDVRSQVPA
jgi:cation diffusion facilitator CzcD-associated flavoprotein CzcO